MTIQQEREIHDDTSTLERGTEWSPTGCSPRPHACRAMP